VFRALRFKYFLRVHYTDNMPLMNGPKRIRRIQSTTNKTSVYTIMGGLAPQTGIPTSSRSALEGRANICQKIPQPGLKNLAGLRYMRRHSILSVNPACSGGSGKRINRCRCCMRF